MFSLELFVYSFHVYCIIKQICLYSNKIEVIFLFILGFDFQNPRLWTSYIIYTAFRFKLHWQFLPQIYMAKSAEAVEYTDYFSANR